MKETRNDHGAYVRKVQEETQSFTQDVLGEMQRLQVLVATLEREVSRQQAQVVALRADGERHQREDDSGTPGRAAASARGTRGRARRTALPQ